MLQGVASSNDDGLDGPNHQQCQIPIVMVMAIKLPLTHELSCCNRCGLWPPPKTPSCSRLGSHAPCEQKLMTQLVPWHHDTRLELDGVGLITCKGPCY
jgi:hypothetical protein